MKVTVRVPKEVDITHIRMVLAVRYDDEDIPYDFPFRLGDTLRLKVEVDSGKIVDWPSGRGVERVHMKVCDEGSYYLLSGENVIYTEESTYVPGIIPGEYGDYVDFTIMPDGTIREWKKFCTKSRIQAFVNDADYEE